MRRQGPLNHFFYGDKSQQDSGKDLFALLFLVMLMLAQIFMIVAYDAVRSKGKQPIDSTGQDANTPLDPHKRPPVGKISQKGNKILIEFDGRLFDPRREGSKLVTSGYTVTTKDEFGREVQVLYINYDGIVDSKVLSRGLAPLRGIGIIPVFPE